MIRRMFPAVLLLVAVAATGCEFSRGIVGGRGTVEQQRAMAGVNDPYPDPDMGPEIVGGRPRDFDQPRSEVRRARWWENSWFSF